MAELETSRPTPLSLGPDQVDVDYAGEREAGPPIQPEVPPGQWLRENLFGSVTNGVVTVVSVLFALWAARGLLNFVFSEERQWAAVRTNLRLLFTQAYPESQYVRVWVSLGLLVALAGVSAGLWARWGGVPLGRVARWALAAGAGIALGVVLREPGARFDEEGEPLLDAANQVVRQSFGQAMADRTLWWVAAVVLLAVGLAVWFGVREHRRSVYVPVTVLVGTALGLAVGSLWVVPYGHYGFANGEFLAEPGRTVVLSTKVPWTVMFVLLVGTTYLGRWVRSMDWQSRVGPLVNIGWVLSPFVTYWVILRDPALDYGYVARVDLPLFVAFAGLGGLVLWALTSPGIGESGRVIAVGLLLLALLHWVAGFAGWYPMLQKVRISFLVVALFALAAPNFAGGASKRRRFLAGWVLTIGLLHYVITMINTPSTVVTPSDTFLGGFSVTLFVAVMTLMLSFPLGVLLALARTSRLPIFRVLSTVYIEVLRGVPLITILIFFSVMVNLFLPGGMSMAELAAVVVGFTLFSAAYLAENVRGGLQAVGRGQYEAADAVGLTNVQRTAFVVLPQALRVSIPPLVGQTIATFKETSLLAIIGIFDFLRIANSVIPSQTEFLGVKREGLLVVSAVYWIFSFTMSKYSQRIERRLGLGER